MTFVLIALTLAAAGVAIWAYMNYLDQKNNVDSKISSAVAVAVKETKDADAAEFLEKQKQPNRQFVGQTTMDVCHLIIQKPGVSTKPKA